MTRRRRRQKIKNRAVAVDYKVGKQQQKLHTFIFARCRVITTQSVRAFLEELHEPQNITLVSVTRTPVEKLINK